MTLSNKFHIHTAYIHIIFIHISLRKKKMNPFTAHTHRPNVDK